MHHGIKGPLLSLRTGIFPAIMTKSGKEKTSPTQDRQQADGSNEREALRCNLSCPTCASLARLSTLCAAPHCCVPAWGTTSASHEALRNISMGWCSPGSSWGKRDALLLLFSQVTTGHLIAVEWCQAHIARHLLLISHIFSPVSSTHTLPACFPTSRLKAFHILLALFQLSWQNTVSPISNCWKHPNNLPGRYLW